jgi:hypothetical protein
MIGTLFSRLHAPYGLSEDDLASRVVYGIAPPKA